MSAASARSKAGATTPADTAADNAEAVEPSTEKITINAVDSEVMGRVRGLLARSINVDGPWPVKVPGPDGNAVEVEVDGISAFANAAFMLLLAKSEKELNGGKPWQPPATGRLPKGRKPRAR